MNGMVVSCWVAEKVHAPWKSVEVGYNVHDKGILQVGRLEVDSKIDNSTRIPVVLFEGE